MPMRPDILDDRDGLLTRKKPRVPPQVRADPERWAREGLGPKPIKINRRVHYRLRDLRGAAKGASDVIAPAGKAGARSVWIERLEPSRSAARTRPAREHHDPIADVPGRRCRWGWCHDQQY